MGAAGVVLAAAAAHAAPGAGLDSAAYLLLFHAVAVLGAAALAQQGLLWPPAALAAMAGFVLGARAVCRRRLDAGLRRPSAVSDGGADRRDHPDRGLARAGACGIRHNRPRALTPLPRLRHER